MPNWNIRFLGSYYSNARAREGWGKHIFLFPPFQKATASPAERASKQAGKKEGGLGEGIFARLLCPPKADWGWEAARPCVSKEAKPAKIVSLIEKDFCARPLKEKEIFAGFACPAVSGASRWAGSAPVRTQIVVQRKFERSSVIATIRYFQSFLMRRKARSAPLTLGSARKFPYISALNQRADGNQTGFFCPAGGGSWAQSAQSKSHLIENLLNAFALQFFPPFAKGKRTKQVFNPALYTAPMAQWPKATNLKAI